MGLHGLMQAQPCLEHEITQEAIENALSTIKQTSHDIEHSNDSSPCNSTNSIDLNKVNSSSERPLIKFDDVEERIAAIEQQMTTLSLQLKMLKDQIKGLKTTAQEIINAKQQSTSNVSVQNVLEISEQEVDKNEPEPIS